ncbi:MAG: hypothetical protein IID45_10385 [Planctomycetes bacterium]|nr:hypothetical protein [Planctomycetota bacterium]
MMTGLVPIAAQRKAYRERFKDANLVPGRTPDMDRPRYQLYIIERAEVVPGAAKLTWKPMWDAETYMKRLAKFWAEEGRPEELVEKKYIEPRLVYVVKQMDGVLPPLLLMMSIRPSPVKSAATAVLVCSPA